VEHTFEVLIKSHRLEKNLVDAETGMRGFKLSNDSVFLEPYFWATKNCPILFQELKTLIRDNAIIIKVKQLVML
jgi:two-component system, chemotaxis family, sensor kinase CheA